MLNTAKSLTLRLRSMFSCKNPLSLTGLLEGMPSSPSICRSKKVTFTIEGDAGDGLVEWAGCISTRSTCVNIKVNVPEKSLQSSFAKQIKDSPVKERADSDASDVTDIDRSVSSSDDEKGYNRLNESQASLRQQEHETKEQRTVAVDGKAVGPLDWGYPGYLTPTEGETLEQFRKEVRRRGRSFREAIFCFGENEPENFALCRWLRARKFVYEDVIAMVEQAATTRADPRRHGFYADPQQALGVDESIMKTQYPQCFTSGHSKTGNPLFCSKLGLVNINGVGAVTTAEGLNRYQWHSNIHVLSKRFKDRQADNPNYQR